jgi:hypothetical protein
LNQALKLLTAGVLVEFKTVSKKQTPEEALAFRGKEVFLSVSQN